MDREELVRLAGEQALLTKELGELNSQQHRDKQAILSMHNSIPTGMGRNSTWLADGIALLTRINDTQARLHEMYGKLAELKKLTGL